MNTPVAVAELFGIEADRLLKHLRVPLATPRSNPLAGWPRHPKLEKLLALCDGFALFHPGPPLRIFGSQDYQELRDSEINSDSSRLGLLPILGDCPHLTSLLVSTGAVVATDWEVKAQPQDGWLRHIAGSFEEYIRTAIEVREAYGEPEGAWPSDWWGPYASSGDRYDLEKR